MNHQNIKIRILLLVFASITIFTLQAQQTIERIKNQPYLKHKDGVDCNNAETTFEMRVCANLRLQEVDSVMNDVYSQVLNAIFVFPIGNEAEMLQKAHFRWLEYRDTHCQVYSELYGTGSFKPIVYMNCLTRLTEHRTKDLSILLEEL